MVLARRDLAESADDSATATRAAWLYHVGELTQSQVAARLGVPNAKAHRLIARATRAGLVRVFVEGPIGGCIALEEQLTGQFGLRFCRVVPNVDAASLPLRSLGAAAAIYLTEALERGEHRVIGVGHGRTLAAAIEQLPRVAAPNVCFVSLLGGVSRQTSANPFDVIHRLAEKTGAESWMLPVPFIANTAADRQVMLAQRGIAEAMQMAAQATLCLVGIGEVGGDAFIASTGMISPSEVQQLVARGAIGEVLGHYLDAGGIPVPTPLHERILSLPFDGLRGREVVGVAGGRDKPDAIRSVLRGGLLSGLITDEPTARRLTAEQPARKTGKGRARHARESTRSV